MAAHVPVRGLPPKAPDKGSFPLDHFGECSEAKASYMKCLKEHGMHADAEACRKLSAAYLQCRMDTKLMAREDLSKLGYVAASAEKASSNVMRGEDAHADHRSRRRGFIAGLPPPQEQPKDSASSTKTRAPPVADG